MDHRISHQSGEVPRNLWMTGAGFHHCPGGHRCRRRPSNDCRCPVYIADVILKSDPGVGDDIFLGGDLEWQSAGSRTSLRNPQAGSGPIIMGLGRQGSRPSDREQVFKMIKGGQTHGNWCCEGD